MRILVNGRVKLLVVNLQNAVQLRAAGRATLVFAGEMEARPISILVVFISHEFDFFRRQGQSHGLLAKSVNRQFRSAMRIDREYHLVAVALSFDECDEQSARLRTEDVLQNTGVQVVTQLSVQGALSPL